MSKKKGQRRLRKRFMVCKEVRMGTYEMPDCGAVHNTPKAAEAHALDCDHSDGHIFVMPIYFPERP